MSRDEGLPAHRSAAARPQGAGDRRAAESLVVDVLSQGIPAGDRPGRGGHGRRRGREPLPRLHGGHRGGVDGVRPSQGGAGDPGGGGALPSYLRQGLLLRELCGTVRAAGGARAEEEQEARVSLELGDRGRGGRDQAGAAFDRAARDRRLHRRVSRPHVRWLEPDGEQVDTTRRVRAIPARGVPRPLRLPLPLRLLPWRDRLYDALRVVHRGRPVRQAARPEEHGRRFRGADPGRGWLRRAAARVSKGAARAVRPPRHPAGVRRGAVRRGTHRKDVGVGARGDRARHSAQRQGPGQRHADRCDHRQRIDHEVAARRARQHLRRQSGVLRGGAGDARRRRARPPPTGAAAWRAVARRGQAAAGEVWLDRRRAGARAHDRRRVREGPRHGRARPRRAARPRPAGGPQGAAAARGGGLHAFRRAVEGGGTRDSGLEIEEYSHFGMVARFAAGAARLPFWPLRDYTGTDLPGVNPRIKSVTCPYTGEDLATVPALNPDVTIVHAQRADADGNTQIWGLLGVQREAAFASQRVVVVVEERVDERVIRSDPNRTVIPGMIVDAVVVEPWGAHPSYAQGYYDRDNDFYVAWEDVSRSPDRLARYLDEFVYGLPDRAAYMKKQPQAARLQAKARLCSGVNYGY